ncbi:hypothetical protein IMZ48_46955 [Candidatus Bathyarchaeota archaeon]|nr:hypothetical protein [Candidatus Bathyarchaeota archaeon]
MTISSLTSDMYKHIIAAAKALKERSDARGMDDRSTRMAEHRASNASETGALPFPLATIDNPRALMAGERKCSSDVPIRDGRTPTQAPHMRERDGDEMLDMKESSLAGM